MSIMQNNELFTARGDNKLWICSFISEMNCNVDYKLVKYRNIYFQWKIVTYDISILFKSIIIYDWLIMDSYVQYIFIKHDQDRYNSISPTLYLADKLCVFLKWKNIKETSWSNLCSKRHLWISKMTLRFGFWIHSHMPQ